MAWDYNPPAQYECVTCGHTYPFKRDTIFMATHEGRPGFCLKCKGSNTVKVEKPKEDVNFDWD